MTFTEAAVEVLRLVGKPLHYKKITEIAIERNLLSHVGKTPEITMSSRLATMVKKDRGDAPIIKVKPGIFGLREFPEEVLGADDSDGEIDLDTLDAVVEVIEPVNEAAPVEVVEIRVPKPEHKLPGTEVFPEEDDDDEPILGKLGEEEEEREDDNAKRRKRRRRRRGAEGEAEASEQPAGR